MTDQEKFERLLVLERQVSQEVDRRIADLSVQYRARMAEVLSEQEMQVIDDYMGVILDDADTFELSSDAAAAFARIESDPEARQVLSRLYSYVDLKLRAELIASGGTKPAE